VSKRQTGRADQFGIQHLDTPLTGGVREPADRMTEV
jgi:hypothetical protein